MSSHSNQSSSFLVYLLWASIVLLVLSLTLYQLRFWIMGPQIDIAQTQILTEKARVPISFNVSNTVSVEINGRAVVPEEGGEVAYLLYVQPGTSIAAIDLYDKYQNHKRTYLYITYPQLSRIPD